MLAADAIVLATPVYFYSMNAQLKALIDRAVSRWDDFQKLSKGTYNAGELRLTYSGKLDIVNNHKTWTILNNKSVDAADSFAIRVAFAKAMEAGGVDEKAMQGVRKSLGLGDDNSMSSGKAIMPLTRQEVRQLIDANISAINANRSADRKLRDRLDRSHALLNEIATLEVDESVNLGKDTSK